MIIKTFRAFLAAQLGFPSGCFGRLLVQFLNQNNQEMNNAILKLLDPQSSDLILEIGFGGGDLIHKIIGLSSPLLIVGVERSPEALKFCHQRFSNLINKGEIELDLGDVHRLTFPDEHFSKICTVNTIYFWENMTQALHECQRVLQPQGKLVIGYASKAYLEQKKLSQHSFSAYEPSEVETMMKLAGFREIQTVSHQSDRTYQFFCTFGIV